MVNGNALEITNDENYDSFLFRIEFNGKEINVTKSEHYTDDINAIAMKKLTQEPTAFGGAFSTEISARTQ